jgi:hypothetical protein
MKETKMKATNTKVRKTTKKPSRSSAQSPLDQRLLAYALGGGALALAATPADAAVIGSGVRNIQVASPGPENGNNYTTLNLDPSDGTSPTFQFGWRNGDGVVLYQVSQGQQGLVQFVTSSLWTLDNLLTGETVGPLSPPTKKTYPRYDDQGGAAGYVGNGAWSEGNWSAGGSGYAGFFFNDANLQPHYGWMELTVPTTSADGEIATLVQWAWESDANTPITISPGAAAVPEIDPASAGSALALLVGGLALVEQQLGFAAGAAGLRAWRKRRRAVA